MKLKRKQAIFLRATFFLIVMGGCCLPYEEPQSTLPTKTEGWHKAESEKDKLAGEWVLRKGESTNNGKVGIRLTEISKLVTCRSPLREEPFKSFTLQFYDVSDGKVICDDLNYMSDVAIGGQGFSKCISQAGFDFISINGINTKEGWVWFELRY